MKNRTLIIILVVLLVIYLASRLLSSDRERSFNPDIVELDTANVTSIVITPKDTSDIPFTLQRNGDQWTITSGAGSYRATQASVGSLLGNLASIKAERVVTKNPDKWSDYDVSENSGTRVQVYRGDQLNTDMFIGRFNFNQMNRSGNSYVRLASDSDVYSVDGFLSMSISQDPANYRDQNVTQLNKENLTRIKFQSPDLDAYYQRDSIGWTDESGSKIDSSAMESYLNPLQSVNGITFADDFNMEEGSLISQLVIEGNNMEVPVIVDCFASQDTLHDFVIRSSSNQEGYFSSDSSGIYSRLFGKFLEIRN